MKLSSILKRVVCVAMISASLLLAVNAFAHSAVNVSIRVMAHSSGALAVISDTDTPHCGRLFYVSEWDQDIKSLATQLSIGGFKVTYYSDVKKGIRKKRKK